MCDFLRHFQIAALGLAIEEGEYADTVVDVSATAARCVSSLSEYRT